MEAEASHHPMTAAAEQSMLADTCDACPSSDSEDGDAAISLPAVVGDYVLTELLGSGGMGQVYAAHRTTGEEEIAIKLLRPDLVSRNNVRARFRREAELMQALDGRHAVRVYEVQTSPVPFIAMERLRGLDLEAIVAQRAPLTLREAVHWTLQACDAMAEAHDRGVIHRDLKPANLFVAITPEGPTLKVLDFGISRAVADTTRITATQTTLGTPIYMSPEQTRCSKDVDAHSDVWSLGVILYELVTGQVPFPGEAPGDVAVNVCTVLPLPPSYLCEGLPTELERIILRALEKNPDDRQPTIRELGAELRAFSRGESVPPLSAPVATVPTFVRHARQRSRRRIAVLGALVVAAACAVGFAVTPRHEREARAAVQPAGQPPIPARTVEDPRGLLTPSPEQPVVQPLPERTSAPPPVERERPAPALSITSAAPGTFPPTVTVDASPTWQSAPRRLRPRFDERAGR